MHDSGPHLDQPQCPAGKLHNCNMKRSRWSGWSWRAGRGHAWLDRCIDHLDFLDASIATLSAEICARLVPFEPQVALLTSIPGISATTAQVIVAETGADMSRFPTAGHLCAWAGVAPASYKSAGKKRPAVTRKGAPWLRRTLIEAARAAARTKGSYCSALCARIARRRGPTRRRSPSHTRRSRPPGTCSLPVPSTKPGADYFERRHDPVIEGKRLQRRTEALGFSVTIEGRPRSHTPFESSTCHRTDRCLVPRAHTPLTALAIRISPVVGSASRGAPRGGLVPTRPAELSHRCP